MLKTRDELEESVEHLIDMAPGFAEFMASVASVCRMKAEHLRGIWQDEAAAGGWDAYANQIDEHVIGI